MKIALILEDSVAVDSRTQSPGLESLDERVLPFSHANARTGYVSRKQTSNEINISLKLVLQIDVK